jgi:hypothetical protein
MTLIYSAFFVLYLEIINLFINLTSLVFFGQSVINFLALQMIQNITETVSKAKISKHKSHSAINHTKSMANEAHIIF